MRTSLRLLISRLFRRFGATKFFVAAFSLAAMGCIATNDASRVFQDVSGVARKGDVLMIVDDENAGAYFQLPIDTQLPRVFTFRSDALRRHELSGARLLVDAESIAVLADQRIVVLSERLRALVGSDGLWVEYPPAFSEFGERGLEGLSVLPLPNQVSRVAVGWEGGYPSNTGLQCELDQLASGRALQPLVLVHDLAPSQRRLKLGLDDLTVVTLKVPRPVGDEPAAQRFRSPDLVWNRWEGSGQPEDRGFIVLLCSESGGSERTYGHHWLQRFNGNGDPIGEHIDLNRLAPDGMKGVNWEGLDWFVPSESLIVVAERSPHGPGIAMIVDVPADWRLQASE